ncbi:MAG: leucine-rich repeat domain-containing protein [Oscillospiraceae bacterium]|nr:leucine-rich repeat domain-containing protein [Oscillospiraceae bacterium]
MKKLLRLSAIMLTFAMLLAFIPAGALAADVEGTCGDSLKWELDGTKLIVSGSGEMYDYSPENEAPWYEYRYAIESLSVGEGVASIGSYAFAELENLTLAELGSPKKIGDYALYGCVSLYSVRMDTGVETIGDYVFSECYDLTSVVIPDTLVSIGDGAFEDTCIYGDLIFGDKLTTIGSYAFAACHGLGSVTIPDSVESVGAFAFAECDFLSSAKIGKNTKSIGEGAFACCNELKTITVDSGNTSYKVSGGALLTADGKSLAAYTLDSGSGVTVPQGVEVIGGFAFAGGSGIEGVNLPGGLREIGEYAFADCWSLGSITIPSTVTTIREMAFASVYGIGSLTVPASVTEIGDGAFLDMAALKSFSVESGSRSFSASDGILYNYDKTLLKACPGGRTGSVTVPDTVRDIAPDAFYGCSVSSVSLPSGLRSIGDEAFVSCTELTGFAVPRGLKSVGECVFLNCPSIGSFTADGGNTSFRVLDGVLYTYDMREVVCYPAGSSLSSYTIPDGVRIIRPYAFAYSGIRSVSVPDTAEIIGEGAFLLCEQLRSVSFGKGITEIGNYAFSDCITLRRAVIPESVVYVGEDAFAWCNELDYVSAGGAAFIDSGAFSWCPALKAVWFRGYCPGRYRRARLPGLRRDHRRIY